MYVYTRQPGGLWRGGGVPDVPVAGVLLEGGDDAVEVGQLVQLRDVVPGTVRQPEAAGVVHLVVSVHHLAGDSIHTDTLGHKGGGGKGGGG